MFWTAVNFDCRALRAAKKIGVQNCVCWIVQQSKTAAAKGAIARFAVTAVLICFGKMILSALGNRAILQYGESR
ncbi:MAG: hypothetical protein ACOYKJ_03355 [Candidatus Howiella sp.]|jgi:hypothetical protein